MKIAPILPSCKLVRINEADEAIIDPTIHIIHPDSTNVAEWLADELPDWDSLTAKLIVAGTGQGKSTFVNDILFPYIAERDGRLLIVTGRLALNHQYKYQLLRKMKSSALKTMTDAGIQECIEFDGLPVAFVSYQSLGKFMKEYQQGKVGNFSAVVFDECHWFTSDSLFAEQTGWLLEEIPKVFRNSVRIYMTATPWAVQNLIAQAELAAPMPMKYRTKLVVDGGFMPKLRQLQMYDFPDKEKRYNLTFLPANVRDDLTSLASIIHETPEDEKWLVFTSSKAQGRSLAKALGDRASYIDADSKAGSTWKMLTGESKFDRRVLVTTAVADCGLNINDAAVKHIVIMSTDHVQFMQMLGRKRFLRDETVTVYVPDFSVSQIHQAQASNDRLITALDVFKTTPVRERYALRMREWYCNSQEIRRLIPIDGRGHLYINKCAEQVVMQRKLFYERIVSDFENGAEHPYSDIVCNWLSISDDSTQQVKWYQRDAERKAAVLHFLEQHVNVSNETKAEQEAFASEFKKLYEAAYGKRKSDNQSRGWGSTIINRVFSETEPEFAFRLETTKKAEGKAWILRSKGGEAIK